MRAEDATGIANKVAKRDERAQELIHKALEQGSIEVYGNLKIVVTSFDRIDRMAFLKGNTIYVSVRARRYPEFVLRYIIAHELAHLAVKRHTWRFWKMMGTIYPEYERGKEELVKRQTHYVETF